MTVAGNLTDLCGSVNLSLPGVLALTKHSGCHELVAILSTDELSGTQKDGSPVVPRHGLPFRLCSKGTFDCAGDCGLIGFMVDTQVLAWSDGMTWFARFPVLTCRTMGLYRS
jgi:hypothetical protein